LASIANRSGEQPATPVSHRQEWCAMRPTKSRRALLSILSTCLDHVADWVPERLANHVETITRYRRLVSIACGETGLSELVLSGGGDGLSFEQIQEGVALTPTSLRLL